MNTRRVFIYLLKSEIRVVPIIHIIIYMCGRLIFSPLWFLFVQIDLRNKDDNKEVSLTTSKINYMDPRVSVAWCKRHEVPVEKASRSPLPHPPFSRFSCRV